MCRRRLYFNADRTRRATHVRLLSCRRKYLAGLMASCSGALGSLPATQFVSLLQVYVLRVVPQRRELNIPQATGINRCET